MAINSVSASAQRIPQQPASPQPVKVSRDADGDNDGTKAAQAAKPVEPSKSGKPVSPTLGTFISTTA